MVPCGSPPAVSGSHSSHTGWPSPGWRWRTPTRSAFETFAGPLTEAVLLGTVCVRSGGQRLVWDSANLKVTNSAQANEYLHYEYRQGWTL